jgi:hypothetical protein
MRLEFPLSQQADQADQAGGTARHTVNDGGRKYRNPASHRLAYWQISVNVFIC